MAPPRARGRSLQPAKEVATAARHAGPDLLTVHYTERVDKETEDIMATFRDGATIDHPKQTTFSTTAVAHRLLRDLWIGRNYLATGEVPCLYLQ
jgi:hypothetical protein